ncbi:MAG: DUF3750 domain-containing protein [Bosea sp. (in: a-proteobacteria)]
MRWRKRLLFGFLLLFLLPLASHAVYYRLNGWPPSWSQADWSSSGILPPARPEPEAIVHVLAARVGNWRGIFAHHSWVVVKPAGAARYTRYDVVGWGNPVRVNVRVPDGRWYGNAPDILLTLRGAQATAAIPRIEAAVRDYPHARSGDYIAWPGPNSNTFIANLARAEPALASALLPTAIGKDWRGLFFAGATPSGTGAQVSLAGLLGASIGWIEGIEINVLGLVAGLDFRRPAIKLPGWGRIGMGV